VWQDARADPPIENAALRDYYHTYVVPGSRLYGTPAKVVGVRLRAATLGFLGAGLAGALVLGFLRKPSRWQSLAWMSLLVVSSALAVCYWFGLHYQAPATSLYVFLAVAGLRTGFLVIRPLRRRFGVFAGAVTSLLVANLVHAEAQEHRIDQLRAVTVRQKIVEKLQEVGGRPLVFVHLEKPYDPNVCWVCNDARLADTPVLWAWDRGPAENRRLLAAFPNRQAIVMTLRSGKIEFTELLAATAATSR
jgi:hypothetical protein